MDSDRWLLEYLESKRVPEDVVISPGDIVSEDWGRLLAEFENSGQQVAEFIGGLSDADFNDTVQKLRGLDNTTQWWVIVRGYIDHEIHHRGQLQILLRLKYEG